MRAAAAALVLAFAGPAPAQDAQALFVAISDGNQHAAWLALRRGADPNAKNADGATPLHVAAALGRDGIMKLHGAADSGHPDVVAFLLAAKADAGLKNAAGQTPADLARGRGHADIAAAPGKR
jgi:uncharacterized protein